MTTLATDSSRSYELGDINEIPVIAADIIFEGAATGLNSSGYARPLQAGDKFVGFAIEKADNNTGAAGDKRVRLWKKRSIQLNVAGAVITDVGQPVFASDDDTFVFTPSGNSFVGFVRRWVSAGKVIVEYDVNSYESPYHDIVETKSANYTVDAQDTGKTLWIDTDAITITLPALATELSNLQIVNGGADGAVLVTISPNASDGIQGPDLTAVDDKDLLNTKVTARRGDRVTLNQGVAAAWQVSELVGTWAKEA